MCVLLSYFLFFVAILSEFGIIKHTRKASLYDKLFVYFHCFRLAQTVCVRTVAFFGFSVFAGFLNFSIPTSGAGIIGSLCML